MRKLFVMLRSPVWRGRELQEVTRLAIVGIAVAAWLACGEITRAPAQDTPRQGPEGGQRSKNYSPYADRAYPTRVYWGDQHLHTSSSPDTGMSHVGFRCATTGTCR
jgi:hypothetical protein